MEGRRPDQSEGAPFIRPTWSSRFAASSPHPSPTQSVYFNFKYVEEAVAWAKGQAGTFGILADSAENVPKVASAADAMFHTHRKPTKTESEKAFQLSFVASLGNVKAFILSICLAVVFATLLVSANTMAHVDS